MHSHLLSEVIAISKEVGQFLVNEQASILESDIQFKGGSHNLVSRADKEAERMFIRNLAELMPEAGFIAEEGTSTKIGPEANWIIDPLDGTTNYLYGIPCYCTSVALQVNGELQLGVIYDPTRDECFAALRNQGAHLNGKPIRTSTQTVLKKALIATGFPYEANGREADYLSILKEINGSTRGIRRLGSAALDMAYVACGRFDAFYEYGLQKWDCAAGALLIAEANGKVTDFAGSENYLENRTLIGSNPHIYAPLASIFKNW